MSGPATQIATIERFDTLSSPIVLESPGLYAIVLLGPWTAADLSFMISADGGISYGDVWDEKGEVVIAAEPGLWFQLDSDKWMGAVNLLVRSGTSAAPVAQLQDSPVLIVGEFIQPPPAAVLEPIPALTLVGPGGQGYVGEDFPPALPAASRVYTLDFINDLAQQRVVYATVGGTATAGDTIGITFADVPEFGDEETVYYVVQAGDNLASIAAALAARINGTQALTAAQISAAVTGPLIILTYRQAEPLSITSLIIPAPGSAAFQGGETILFADQGFAGEEILSARCSIESFEGAIDPSPASRVLSNATISGSQVSFLIGNLLPGIKYRVTFTATTTQQPAVVLYSHIFCQLPT